MEIVFNEIPAPGIVSFTVFASEEKFRERIQAEKTFTMSISKNTATTASVSVQNGEGRFGANLPIGDYKYHQGTHTQILEGKRTAVSYFKFTKNQHAGVFMKYLKDLVEHYLRTRKIEVDVFTVKLEVGRELREFRSKFPGEVPPEPKAPLHQPALF